MKNCFFYVIILTSIFFACKQNSNSKKLIIQNDIVLPQTIAQIDTTLQTVDSMVVVFYDDPLGNDSLKYTRYYKQYSNTNKADIAFIQTQLNDTTTKLESVKPCRSEGKIWCFSKKDILQTIYFSSYTNACSHIYIIKNGFFYYTNINVALIEKLKTFKTKATTP